MTSSLAGVVWVGEQVPSASGVVGQQAVQIPHGPAVPSRERQQGRPGGGVLYLAHGGESGSWHHLVASNTPRASGTDRRRPHRPFTYGWVDRLV